MSPTWCLWWRPGHLVVEETCVEMRETNLLQSPDDKQYCRTKKRSHVDDEAMQRKSRG